MFQAFCLADVQDIPIDALHQINSWLCREFLKRFLNIWKKRYETSHIFKGIENTEKVKKNFEPINFSVMNTDFCIDNPIPFGDIMVVLPAT